MAAKSFTLVLHMTLVVVVIFISTSTCTPINNRSEKQSMNMKPVALPEANIKGARQGRLSYMTYPAPMGYRGSSFSPFLVTAVPGAFGFAPTRRHGFFVK